MKILGINNTVTFERRPTKEEEPGLQAACQKTFELMGTKDRIIITHGSCFPALGYDSYIGSPYGKAAKKYMKFLQLYGFNGNQLGPGGELEMMSPGMLKPSPYNSSAFAKNKLFIDLEELTTDNYGNILSGETFNKVTSIPKITDKDYALTNFNEALKTYDTALTESFNNFKANLAKGQPQAIALDKEFKQFLKWHNKRLTDEGVFKVLANHYKTDKFEDWDNDLDKNLMDYVANGDIEALDRLATIKKANKKQIEQYKFEQFIATKQIKENKQWRDENNFKYINDLLIGCSKMDEWRYKDVFLDNYSIGAYEGNGKHQLWWLPVINPKKIFIGPELKLNRGGQFIKDKLDYALEFCENTRIDHVMGLVEPFLIRKDSIAFDENHNLDYGKLQGSLMSQTQENGQKIDDYYNYPRILEKIILPTLKEHNLKPSDPIWETICSNPDIFKEVYYNQLKLPELMTLQWERAETPKFDSKFPIQDNIIKWNERWALLGSHDDIPVQRMLAEKDWVRNNQAWNPLYLAGYLNQDPARAKRRDEFCDKISDCNPDQTRKTGEELKKADAERVKAKFAELMTRKKFELSFADLFGITDIVYNIGGVDKKDNWQERLSPDFIDKYYKNLASENPTAINVPEVLKIALQAEIDRAVLQSPYKKELRKNLYTECRPLLNELQKYADILKEPEPQQ